MFNVATKRRDLLIKNDHIPRVYPGGCLATCNKVGHFFFNVAGQTLLVNNVRAKRVFITRAAEARLPPQGGVRSGKTGESRGAEPPLAGGAGGSPPGRDEGCKQHTVPK